MANPKHIEWLLEADTFIELWNLQVANGKFRPDFAGASLFDEFYAAGKIENGKNILLAKADFRYANFTAADLSSAELTGADLQRVKLTGVGLWDTILADANLYYSDLHRADLRG